MKRFLTCIIAGIICIFACCVSAEKLPLWNGGETDAVLCEMIGSGVFTYDYDSEDSGFRFYTSYAGQHPRMLVDSARLNEIRNNSEYGFIKEKFLTRADELLLKKIPTWAESKDDTTSMNRPVGDNIAELAAAYLITGDEKYYYGTDDGCYGVLPGIIAACSWYPQWGMEKNGTVNNDLVCAHMLRGLGIAYDYCYEILPQDIKELILSTAEERGSVMYQRLRQTSNGYLHNHPMVNFAGLTIFALSAFEDFEPAEIWMREAFNYMNISFRCFGDDGAWQEGVGYSHYAITYLIAYAECAKKFYQTDLYGLNSFFENYGDYLYYLKKFSLDDNVSFNLLYGNTTENDAADTAAYLYKLADIYKNGYTQSFARQVFCLMRGCSFTTLMYYNPNIKEISLSDKPLAHHFIDQEIVVDSAGRDPRLPTFSAKCGPMPGHKAVANSTGSSYGSGHADPDANHFSVIGYDYEWLFSDDALWSYGVSATNHHNTLMINNTGQIGESGNGQFSVLTQWFKDKSLQPGFSAADSNDEYAYYVGEAAKAYDSSAGLKKFNRHYVFIKPNILILTDDIETEQTAELELRFLPEITESTLTGNGEYYIRGEKNDLKIKNLTPSGVDSGEGMQALTIDGKTGEAEDKYVITYRHTGNTWRNITAITWSKKGMEQPKVECVEQSNGKILIAANESNYVLDCEEQTFVSCNRMIYMSNGTESGEPEDGYNTVTYFYHGDEDKTLSLIMARYEGGRLAQIDVDRKKTVPNSVLKFMAELDMEGVSENTVLKCFLWDDSLQVVDKGLDMGAYENVPPLSSEADILSLYIAGTDRVYELPARDGFDKEVYQSHLNRYVVFYTDDETERIKKAVPVIEVSEGATVYPKYGTEFDLTAEDAVITVISEDGQHTKEYILKAVKTDRSISENFDTEKDRVLISAVDIPGDTESETLNNCINTRLVSGGTLSFGGAGTSVLETTAGGLMINQSDSAGHRLRFPAYGSTLDLGGVGSWMCGGFKLKFDCGIGENVDGTVINFGVAARVTVRDRYTYDSNGRRYVTLLAASKDGTVRIGNVYIGDWFNLEVLMRGLPRREGKLLDLETCYYIDGKVSEDTVNAYYTDINGETRASVIAMYISTAAGSRNRIYLDAVVCKSGKEQ